MTPGPVDDRDTNVPKTAAWLGGLGAIPFIGLAMASAVSGGEWRAFALHSLVTYGAIILSFLGGVHWGLAIATPVRTERASGWLILSIIPSLVGWTALLAPSRVGLLVLSAAFLAMLWIDLRATRLGQAPAWYPKLRIPLTIAVVTALLIGALSA